jgi:hypothetical protein
LLPIIRHTRDCTVKHVGEALFLPNFPLLETPGLTTEGFFHETLRLMAVSPGAKI